MGINKPISLDGQEINVDLTSVNDKLEALQTELSTVKTDVAGVKTDVGTVKGYTDTVENTLSTINSNITTVKSNLATVDGIVDTINANTKLNLRTYKKYSKAFTVLWVSGGEATSTDRAFVTSTDTIILGLKISWTRDIVRPMYIKIVADDVVIFDGTWTPSTGATTAYLFREINGFTIKSSNSNTTYPLGIQAKSFSITYGCSINGSPEKEENAGVFELEYLR